jgi:hypothetical protein
MPELEELAQAMHDAEAAWQAQRTVCDATALKHGEQRRILVHLAGKLTEAQKAHSEAWHAHAQASQCPVKSDDALQAWEDPRMCLIWAEASRKDQARIQAQADRCGAQAQVWEDRARQLRTEGDRE